MSKHPKLLATLFPWLLLSLMLVGCAGLERPADEASRDWNMHRQQLAALDQWRANGKVALSSAQGAESARLQWQQRGEETDLLLSGPIGLAATRIYSDGMRLDIDRGSERQSIDISSPDAIGQATGWDLPLTALRYWLKGAPAPHLSIQTLDLDRERGLLVTLRQADWAIHYQQYRAFEGLRLPTRLLISRGSTQARVVITQWRVPPDQ